MQFRHPESYRILSDGRILQDPMGSGVGYVDLGRLLFNEIFKFRYCAHNLTEKVEIRRCSILSIEIQIALGLFIIIAGILISVVIFCWRKNRK
jgi:hypothetical protein